MLTDAVLVDRVIAGFDDAFGELYRRHANAAWRVGQAVAGNSHDAADAVSEAFARVLQAVKAGRLQDGDAFKSYLLAATRNAALDGLRRSGKTKPAASSELDRAADGSSPAERVAGGEDAALLAEAFRNLPERWRSVLWLTEVEGVATKDAAAQLGLSPNGTAQLAVRARAGLRDRFLQAHVRNHAKPACRFTVEHLGAYVGGGLSPRDLAKVDQHLADCEDCRDRKAELEDMGASLRRIVLPLPIGLAAASATKVHAALVSSVAPVGAAAVGGGAGVAKVLHLAKQPTPAMRRFVGASAAGVLAIGVLSLGFVDRNHDAKATDLASPSHEASADATTPDQALAVSYASPLTGIVPMGGDSSSDAVRRRSAYVTPSPGGSSTPSAPAPAAPPSGGAPASPQPAPLLPDQTCTLLAALCPPVNNGDPTVGVGANLGGTTIGTTVTANPTDPTSSTIGLTVGDQTLIGSPAPAPSSPNTAVVTSPLGTTTLP